MGRYTKPLIYPVAVHLLFDTGINLKNRTKENWGAKKYETTLLLNICGLDLDTVLVTQFLSFLM
jgi:hypothetical protein